METGERDGRTIFTVTDLKQYTYCPRVVFYTYCLPLVRPTTFKMEAGIAAHEEAAGREQRRNLSAYGLKEGQRRFDVWVESQTLGLRGRVDMVIEVGEGAGREIIPVDYKQTAREAGPNVRQQLAAYGLMLQETSGGACRRGFVYSLVTRKAQEIRLAARLKDDVRQVVAAIRDMVEQEAMPEPPRSRQPCINCEFRRFCNDVL